MKNLGFALCALVVVFLLYVLFLWICALLVDTKRVYMKQSKFYRRILDDATDLLMLVSNVKIHLHGEEKLPSGRFFLVQNHRSKYDPMTTWAALRGRDLAFISKPSNFNIPIFGKLIRKCCYLEMDRENVRNAIVTIENATNLLLNDEVSMGGYPEGTRSLNCELLPYRNGLFKVPQKAKVPIVVTCITGTEKVHKQAPFRRTHVYIDILEVLDAEYVATHKTTEIGEHVREITLKGIADREVHGGDMEYSFSD